MGSIPTVKVRQTDVEYMHKYLDLAIGELANIKALAKDEGHDWILEHADEAEYCVRAVRKTMPPKQTELPF